MFLVNKMKQAGVLLIMLLMLGLTIQGYAAGEPSCGCDLLDPFSAAYDDCVSSCTGVDVPVNGNVWILLLAGIGIVICKNKLAKKFKPASTL